MKNKYSIAAVPMNMVTLLWDRVEGLLQKAIDLSNGDVSVETTYNNVTSGNSLLVVIFDSEENNIVAANTIDIREFDTGNKVLYSPLIAGDDMAEWMEQYIKVCFDLAKQFGCSEVRGICARRGWLRILKESDGWEEIHTIISHKVN